MYLHCTYRRFDEPLRGLAADTMVVFTREDFDYQRAAVLGVVRCLKVRLGFGYLTARVLAYLALQVNFQRNGPLVRRCYYILVEVRLVLLGVLLLVLLLVLILVLQPVLQPAFLSKW